MRGGGEGGREGGEARGERRWGGGGERRWAGEGYGGCVCSTVVAVSCLLGLI